MEERNKDTINPLLVELFKEYDMFDDDEAIERVATICEQYVKLCAEFIRDKDMKHIKELRSLLFDQKMDEVTIALVGSACASFDVYHNNTKKIKMMHGEIIGLVNHITRLQQDNKVLKNLCGNKLKGGG